MKLLKTKNVRFAEVVAHSGPPEVYTLWQKPKTDRRLQTLIKSHRVMTVQQTESGTDFGIADFRERPGARYLAFPKSLNRFGDNRIVGIRWELVKA